MPSGWVHATLDLISFGLPYLDIHQEKDNASKTLGSSHRTEKHPWYQEYGKLWNFSDPFPTWLRQSIQDLLLIKSPDKVEEQMVDLAHDHLDRVWNDLSYIERTYRESFFAWVMFNPSILKSWAGVDVLNSRIQRIVDGQEIWEHCPELKSRYQGLRHYIGAVIRKDWRLQKMLRKYG